MRPSVGSRLVKRRVPELGWAIYDHMTEEKIWSVGDGWAPPQITTKKLAELRSHEGEALNG